MLVAASYAFRLPALLNARSTNSDAAVVGLQAMHMLRGELSPLLWGSGYQTSADAAVAALFFAVLGPSPLVLMLSALTLHVVSTLLVFAMLRRRFDPWLALLVVLPLVVSPSSIHSYALYPPRQLSLTLAMAAFWAIDNAGERESTGRWGQGWLAAGGLLATLAVSADPYPLLLLPLLGLYALLVSWPLVLRVSAFAGGAAIGLLPFVMIHRLPGAKSGPMGFTTSMLAHHFRLLADECLPWALSWKVYYAHNVMDYAPWDAPLWFRALGIVGALLLGALVAFGLLAPLRRIGGAIPAPLRRLGFTGALGFPLAIGGFLVSVMVMDHFSMRYLAVLTLLTPFAVAPAAHALGARRFALAFAPHLLASAVAGWVGYGPFVHGVLPVAETPELRDDYALADALRARGVRWATADYWASYRLTYLYREEIVVVPTNAGEDRYAAYRLAFEAAPVFAYVFDPGRSREDVAVAERDLVAASEQVERLKVGGLSVFVVTRRR
ncbi:MAG TPA: glycosyltransferase family 39 protein [Labilithrix sp.]|nr:glycosyltransferase family 39 protein [Labilithrix sp.]